MVGERTSRRWLAILAIVGAALLIGMAAMPQKLAPLSVEEQVAVDRYQRIMKALNEARTGRVGASMINVLKETDPAQTGFIGVEWSYLVTTQGELEAKQTSTHPVWVLMFHEWFREAGLQPGDTIAVGCSASFPALLYSLRVAAASLGLEVRAIASMTASNYGATIPEFDLWAMEEIVLQHNLLPPALVAITPGGEDDAAAGLGDDERSKLKTRLDEIAAQPDAPRVEWPSSLGEAVELREQLLLGQNEIGAMPALFVNIGGNSANIGTGQAALLLPRGFIQPKKHPIPAEKIMRASGYGAIHRALSRGVPVIHLLDVRSLLAARGVAAGSSPGRADAALRLAGRKSPLARVAAAALAMGILALLYILPREKSTIRQIPTLEEI